MRAAIICRGPSAMVTWPAARHHAWRNGPDYDMVIAVNSAAILYCCDWAVALDPQNINAIRYPPAIGYVYRSGFLKNGRKLDLPPSWGNLQAIDGDDKICGVVPDWSIEAALLLCCAAAVKSVDVFGADNGWPDRRPAAPLAEYQTIAAPRTLSNNTPERWRREEQAIRDRLDLCDVNGVAVNYIQG